MNNEPARAVNVGEQIISEKLKSTWELVETGRLTREDYTQEHDSLIQDYSQLWENALRWRSSTTLEDSALQELGEYFEGQDPAEIRKRCQNALSEFKNEWDRNVVPNDPKSIQHFYDQNQSYIYELIWWHTLVYDFSPLAYVSALHFAKRHACANYLDFGTGVSSGGLVFARHGMETSIADISSPLLRFSKWRFEQRGLTVRAYDLKHETLPDGRFDLITAMDVFEHLDDPLGTVATLARALKPNGFLLGRFHTDEDDDRDQHIVRDFGPTFRKLESLGFDQVWEDDWLWGHKAFQRTRAGL
jgi:2-polyprenyl-3-methyl-5-hydroxy-6-metoxy-1,4-benzoquinol methylase